MIYDIRQVTTYDYASPVAFSTHVTRLIPRDRPGQQVMAATLEVSPAPSTRDDRLDFFGNAVTRLTLEAPHEQLRLTMNARVRVDAPAPLDPSTTPAWEKVRDMAMGSAALDPASPAHFLFSSRRVARSTAIRAYAMESFLPGRPVLEAGLDLTRRIQRDFAYDQEATDSATPPDEAFRLKRGVCQDFTHIMIAGLRGLGLPAAYVSGFLRTIAPPGAKRLEGADATHAWVSLWCGPQIGWQGLDPTNGMRTGTDHVVLALGRDYADVSPTDGIVIAAGDHDLTVAVDVVPVGDGPAAMMKRQTAGRDP